MHLVLVTHSYWPLQSPPQRRWQGFIRYLTTQHNYQVTVVTQGIDGQAEEETGPEGERILRTPSTSHHADSRWARLADSARHSARMLGLVTKIGSADLVLATVPALPNLISGSIIAKKLKTPYVVEMRDAWPDLITEAEVGNSLVTGTATRVITELQKSADLVITVTDGFAAQLRERGMTKVVTVPNGVTESLVQLLPHRDRTAGELHVLYLGNHGESQNLGLVIEAAALARHENSQIQIRFVGQGTQKPELESLNERLGNPVQMLGSVPEDHTTRHYAWADTCVVTLRRDWPSFLHTVPSKLYELLGTGKHITALVQGEAADIVEAAGQQVVPATTPRALADHWLALAEDPATTPQYESSHRWALDNVSVEIRSTTLQEALHSIQEEDMGETLGSNRRLATNATIAARTALDHIDQDPALFTVQVASRAPNRLSEMVGKAFTVLGKGPFKTLETVGNTVLGDEQAVRDAIMEAVENQDSGQRILRLVGLAISQGQTDIATWGLDRVRPDAPGRRPVAARLAWYQGHMREAISLLDGPDSQTYRKQRDGYRSQLRVFQGERPHLAPVPSYAPSAENRVLHVLTNSLPHTGSGYAQRSHSILLELRSRGWDVSAVTRLGWPVITGGLTAKEADTIDGIHYKRLLPPTLESDYAKREQQYAELLLEYVLEARPALLHTTSHWTNANAVQAVAEAVGIPWVYEVRGLLADTWASTRSDEAYRSDYYQLFTAREADAVQEADGVVTLGEQMRHRLGTLGADEESIILSPNAIGDVFLDEPRPTQEAREDLGLDLEWEIVGTVSSLVPYEGLDTVVRAVAELAPSRPNLRLLLVGDGTARASLLSLADELGVADRVIAPGRVPREQSRTYHQALDIFVVPRIDSSVTRTVTPMKSIEASASAKPVVASDLPALAELVEDGVTGRLVTAEESHQWAEALKALLEDPHKRRDMGRAGRRWALENRTWASNGARYDELYRKLWKKR